MTECQPNRSAPCCSCPGPKPDRPRSAESVFVGGLRPGSPVLQDAFRPFYLGAAVFAAVAVGLWLSMWKHGAPVPAVPALLWHMHEMVFGFAAAVIVGFLFTAARHWTGLPLPAGVPLAILMSLWLLGRVGMFFRYGWPTAVVDTALLPLVAAVLASRFARSRSLGNLPLVAVLLALSLANAAFHASMLGFVDLAPVACIEAGLMLVVLVEVLIGSRVVPGFTANASPGARQWRPPALRFAALWAAVAAVAMDVAGLPPALAGSMAFLASILLAALALGWNPVAARSRPILLVLHVSFAWIPIGFALLGLAAFGAVTRSAAIHALSVGSMGGLIIGMMTRTALGHSGRAVRAGGWEILAYLLVQAAAVARVLGAAWPEVSQQFILASGAAWIAAFTTYAVAYAPVLMGRRATAVASAT